MRANRDFTPDLQTQQDAREFLALMLSTVHSECHEDAADDLGEGDDRDLDTEWARYLEEEDSVVSRFLHGQSAFLDIKCSGMTCIAMQAKQRT